MAPPITQGGHKNRDAQKNRSNHKAVESHVLPIGLLVALHLCENITRLISWCPTNESWYYIVARMSIDLVRMFSRRRRRTDRACLVRRKTCWRTCVVQRMRVDHWAQQTSSAASAHRVAEDTWCDCLPGSAVDNPSSPRPPPPDRSYLNTHTHTYVANTHLFSSFLELDRKTIL